MVRLLESVLERVRQLPDNEQDDSILEQLEADVKWDAVFEKHADKMGALADEIRRADDEGKTVEMGWDEI